MDPLNIYHPNKYNFSIVGKIDCPLHNNFGIELAIVIKGELKMKIENEAFTLTEGQGIFIYPFESHDYVCGEDCKYISILLSEKTINVFFDNIGSKYCELKNRLFIAPYKTIDYFVFLINNYKTSNYEEDDTLLLNVISPFLFLIKKQCKFSNENVYNNAFTSAINYINNNLQNELMLKKIAESIGVNPSYLSRTFSKNAKMNITKYISIRRCILASHYILTTKKSITEIGLEVGFNSIRNFNRTFLEYFDLSPKEYKCLCESKIK